MTRYRSETDALAGVLGEEPRKQVEERVVFVHRLRHYIFLGYCHAGAPDFDNNISEFVADDRRDVRDDRNGGTNFCLSLSGIRLGVFSARKPKRSSVSRTI